MLIAILIPLLSLIFLLLTFAGRLIFRKHSLWYSQDSTLYNLPCLFLLGCTNYKRLFHSRTPGLTPYAIRIASSARSHNQLFRCIRTPGLTPYAIRIASSARSHNQLFRCIRTPGLSPEALVASNRLYKPEASRDGGRQVQTTSPLLNFKKRKVSFNF